MAKGLMLLGGVLFAAGAWMAWGPKIPLLGKLPGDILIRRGASTFYFPVASCIVISVIVTLLLRWLGPK
jgi:hypothetical protein